MPRLKLARRLLELMTASKEKVLWNIQIGRKRASYKGWGRIVNKVFVGGGGNTGSDCNKMCGQWAKKFIEGGCNLEDLAMLTM